MRDAKPTPRSLPLLARRLDSSRVGTYMPCLPGVVIRRGRHRARSMTGKTSKGLKELQRECQGGVREVGLPASPDGPLRGTWPAADLVGVCRKPIRPTRSLRQKCRVDGKGQRRAIPPMILSHPNDHDNRSFSSSSALAASARAPAWERLAGPESTPESR